MRTLYHWPLDPGSRQVRIVLTEKSIETSLEVVQPWRDTHLVELNPSGLTPVLVTGEASSQSIIAETRPILEYLEEINKDPALMPGDSVDRAEIRRICAWFDRKFDNEVNAYLLHEKLEKRVQSLGAPDMDAIRTGKDFLKWHLDYLSGLLMDRDGLAGPRYTLADIAAAAHLSCLDYFGDVPWDDFQPVRTWYERIKCRPSFRGPLQDRLPGIPPVSWYSELDF